MMKTVTNLENEINYKKLKAGVSQQTLRRLDKNFKSFFKTIKDWKKNQLSIWLNQNRLNLLKEFFIT